MKYRHSVPSIFNGAATLITMNWLLVSFGVVSGDWDKMFYLGIVCLAAFLILECLILRVIDRYRDWQAERRFLKRMQTYD